VAEGLAELVSPLDRARSALEGDKLDKAVLVKG
jgi:hypothetical protein